MTSRSTRRWVAWLGVFGLLLASAYGVWAALQTPAQQILSETGVKGGLIVHLGCGDGRLTAALRANDSYLVQGLDADAANVAKAREHIRSLNLYGKISVEQWTGKRLPYTDNLVNLVVSENLGGAPMDEVMRVLVPNGVAYIKTGDQWTKTVKPWPKEIDEWTHDLHGPDGNPVANDRVVGPPKHYQWLAGPFWQRDHDSDASTSMLVSAGGRLFYIQDEAPAGLTGDHPVPDKWFLIARDAFNGVLLWQRPIEHWGWREWKQTWFKSKMGLFPLNIGKRLVAAGDKVYVTLGYHAPVSQLDAATGEALQTYPGTEDTNEIIHHDGTLILSVLRQGRLGAMAITADTGKVRWEVRADCRGSTNEVLRWGEQYGKVEPAKVDPVLNLVADGKRVCFLNGPEIVCLDFMTGAERWRLKPKEKDTDLMVGTLIVYDKAVLYADERELVVLSAETGKKLWSKPHQGLGFYSWKDVFVIEGLVWTWGVESDRIAYGTHPLTKKPMRSSWPLYAYGYDPLTGEIRKKVDLRGIFKSPHHHRCYRNKATDRYILASRRGAEFVDLEAGQHGVNNWVRGTCQTGMIPANGLLYAPPHPCMCYIQEKLNGFNALAPELPSEATKDKTDSGPRLERGPAFGKSDGAEAAAGDWPSFRHDPMRSGAATTALPEGVKLLWTVPLGGKLSPPTIVGDRLFVALIDEHQVAALDAADGKKLWAFTAGGRVDTPPTYHKGAVLFGSADGWAYCLRASDGELVWRFRAAPEDRRIGAYGQLESAWPLHGNVLVQNGVAYFAAGRSSHLDGGIYLYGVDAMTGELKYQTHLEGPDRNFADKATDNFVTPKDAGALMDLLQGDGQCIYMRNLAFDAKLAKLDRSNTEILRVATGFLDDAYFKRTSWSFGRNPKATWGQLVGLDDRSVYSLRMFTPPRCLDPTNYFVPGKEGYQLLAVPRRQSSQIRVANSSSLNPAGKPLTVEAWVKASKPDGAVLARGGTACGYALVLKDGKPRFVIRAKDGVNEVRAPEDVVGRWVHLAGALTEEKQLQIYVDGHLAASAKASGFLGSPGQAMEIGADAGTNVGDYQSPFPFTGLMDEVRIYHRALSETEIQDHCAKPGQVTGKEAGPALYFSFDHGDAKDESGNGNDGEVDAALSVEGRSGKAMQFTAGDGTAWSVRVPIRVRTMIPTGKLLFIAGPPDVVDPNDPLGAFEGRKGGLLWAVSAATGEKLSDCKLDSPPVFNGMAAANGRLYLATTDGKVVCMSGSK